MEKKQTGKSYDYEIEISGVTQEFEKKDGKFLALDAQTRAQLQENLLKTWEQERKTCFFITHDVEEAVLLATKIIIMSAGPGHITEIVPVTLPYPRTQQTKLTSEFNELKNQIWNKVYREYLEHTK